VPKEKTETAMKRIWSEIEKWYKKNTTRLYKKLRRGVTKKELDAFVNAIGVKLPADYVASLKIHDGDVYLHDYNYLRVSAAQRMWELMTQANEEGMFKKKKVVGRRGETIQNTWWHSGWIPFAEDSGGNMYCLDTAPTEKGVFGQVIKMELASGPFPTEFHSFREWLEKYKDDLYGGVYEVDDEGFIVEKMN
jgi:cell wall assembly regulator SMI1